MSLASAAASSTPNTGHKRERRKDARPGELLAAALDVFVEKGFAATRVEEIAQRAGVSKGTLFLYFASKEELFKALVRENITSNFPHWREGLQNFSGSMAAMLHLSAQGWWMHVGDTKASGIMKLMVSEGAKFPDLSRFYQEEVIAPGDQLLLGILQRGVDLGEFRADVPLVDVVHSFVAAMLYLMIVKHMAQSEQALTLPIDPRTFLSNHVSLLLAGICVQTNTGALAQAQAEAYMSTMVHDSECQPCSVLSS